MSPAFDSRLITIRDPSALPWTSVALELVVLAVAGLTLRHALRAHRSGDRAALITWVTIFVYGLVMEVVSYNTVDNFEHGAFTISFYDHQLPLYIAVIYPVLLYTGIATARWLGLPPAFEAVAAGILIVAVDAPFDVVGPVARWWTWSDGDPNTAYRWAGVPVTSFYWHCAFGGILAALTARAARHRRPPLWLAVPLSLATIVAGVIAFLPFHGLRALGVPDGLIVGALLGVCAALTAFAAATRRAPRPRDPALLGFWLPFVGYDLLVMLLLRR